MNDSCRDLLIAWSLLPFLSPSRTRLLLEFYDPPERALYASSETLRGLLKIDAEQAELVRRPFRDRARVEALRDSVITLADGGYPLQLKEIIDPPLALHFRGDVSILALPSIALVGSRRASPYAMNVARHLSRALAPSGLAIVSGLARGVDAASHEAALDAGGKTIAVLGTGIDVVYPRSNAKLFRRIEREGLLLTELAPSSPPLAANFPIRNRIISGLTLGTVIVEATSRSGSLITARTAAEQGREVFAVPGSIFSSGTEGTHRLIQYGAKLVHEPQDVIDELPRHIRLAVSPPPAPPPELLREVLEVFRRDEALHIEAAAAKLGRAVPSLSEELLQLELGGWLEALPGARYVRRS
ncbi:MAG TPA: DNA-processing protein DprA [Thermoanaerobaculia bacterium]|nr:DNA-processing protein DprA [Thermoanaerobaculia bacterium]